MVIMAIDHIRDYVHGDSQLFAPDDLTRTHAALFFTRWITHFCAPTFIFLAGTSASLASRKRANPSEMSRFLFTRGLWLVIVEITLVSWAVNFTYSFTLLQVIWAIGWSMMALAALIHLPWRALLIVSPVAIAGHNLLDPIQPERFRTFAWLWDVLHGRRMVQPGGRLVLIAYPLIPWIFVISAGWCFGPIFDIEPARRRQLLLGRADVDRGVRRAPVPQRPPRSASLGTETAGPMSSKKAAYKKACHLFPGVSIRTCANHKDTKARRMLFIGTLSVLASFPQSSGISDRQAPHPSELTPKKPILLEFFDTIGTLLRLPIL